MPLDKTSRILVIDDSPAIRVHLRDILKKRGYKDVVQASSADAGLEAFKETKPALVFVDLMMPGKSGLDFVRDALARNPRAEIVVVSALPPSEDAVVAAVAHGATDYLRKPLREDAVASVLARLGPEETEGVEPSYV